MEHMITKTTRRAGVYHQKGEDNNAAKLDADAVRAIRASSAPTSEIAAVLDVNVTTVQRVKSRKIWAHVD
jgi:DNA invertase Pin-like site-specific DNA recombinase